MFPIGLRFIGLDNNKLTSLGSAGNNVANLQAVDVGNNPNLGSIDNSWISSATNLKIIDAANCGLTTYPNDVQKLPILQKNACPLFIELYTSLGITL